jgi:ketopantoate hydroxymethyltransferase
LAYANAVRHQEYPKDEHSFHIKKNELEDWINAHQ